MRYAVKLGTQLQISIEQIEHGKAFDKFLRHEIGCELYEVVRPKGLRKPFILLIDESGLLKEKPEVNFIASYLYGTHEHRRPICGTAIIMAIDGPNIRSLSNDEAWAVAGEMNNLSIKAYKRVKRAIFGDLEHSAKPTEN